MYIKKGSLFLRGDNRWEARLFVDGKQHTVACCKSKVNAYNKLKDAVANFKKGVVPAAKKQSVLFYFDWLDNWLETYKRPDLSISGYKNIECNIRLHLKPNFTDCDMKKITAIEIKNTLNKIESSKIKQYVFDIFNESLRNAYNNDLIVKNPCLSLKRPQHKIVKGVALSKAEQEVFLKEVVKTRYANYYLFLLFSGCRPTEPLLIKKSDIDFDNNTIYIPGTKTAQSKRYLPIFNFMRPTLLAQLDTSKTDYLFDFTRDSIRNDFKKIKSIASNFTLKTLRHTFATRAFESGIDLKIISQWLGHSDISITAKVYVDVLRSFEHKKFLQNDTSFDTSFLSERDKKEKDD